MAAKWVRAGQFLFHKFLLFSASDVGDYVQTSVMMMLQGGDSCYCPVVHTHCGGYFAHGLLGMYIYFLERQYVARRFRELV